MSNEKINLELLETLKAAREHLEYCGYGDSWERECAFDSGLPKRIDAAIEKAENENRTRNPQKT